MSIHSSLKIASAGTGERNVWTRTERIVALKKVGRWEEGDSVLGLPKVRTRFKVKTKKEVKADAVTPGEGVEGVEGVEPAEGETGAEAKPPAGG